MIHNDKLREECAVFGISSNSDIAAGITYNGLYSLQHRGQEGAGIAVVTDNKILYHKDAGLVSEVFTASVLDKLPKGRVAVGHARYSTTGSHSTANVGPFIVEYLTGRIAAAHNGNLTNAHHIKDGLLSFGLNFSATSDSEVITSLIAYYITRLGNTVDGIIKACSYLEGAFSLVIAANDNKLIAVRDPNGYRPLCIGESEYGMAIASESCALTSGGFKNIEDVKPGEIVVIEEGKVTHRDIALSSNKKNAGLCIFEYVYFARPDSTIDGLSVYESRYNMGAILAEEYPVDADIVCGVPDSGLEAAAGYAAKSGIPLTTGFVKNRYIGRSFIFPTQELRDAAVRIKLNPLSHTIAGKKVVLVDDSIVRGTTSERIITALKSAGAAEVHMRISSPPFLYTCHYGTDIDDEKNLIANNMSVDEICEKIGADSLGYISIDGLKQACKSCNLSFCTDCFTGSTVKGTKKTVMER